MSKKEELTSNHKDRFIRTSHNIIKYAVKALSILMILVILRSVMDVVYVLYQKLINSEPFFLLNLSDTFEVFGSFLTVLIAIEIFQNITVYIRTDVMPIKLVIATALMAIARKVIVFDFEIINPMFLFGISATIISLGITYRLIDHSYVMKERIKKRKK